MKGKTIALPEAGQGCLGPSFVPFGLEFPYRGCHPVFIEKIRSFYDNLWQWSPPFVQENLWLTKGQALAELSGNAGFTYWDQTNSCSRNVRRRGGQNAPYVRQCGLCSGCLFRRMSLLWAKLESENETNSYLFDAFTLEKLPARLERGPKQQSQQAFFFEGDSKSLDPKVPKQNGHGASDAEVLVYGAVGLDELAQLSQRPQSYTSHVDELSCALGRQRPWVEEKVSTLLAQHAKEWQTFKDALAKNSFLRRCLIA
ncbi:MAG: hypothetical protein EOP84_02780 [Verrucomicrobiaceae bacterium]|nr:MAG: hypothetical protein EOP84_02780 [Verrucomicrobiaceae bacterium]